MSCQHGNWSGCELCEAVDAAWKSGYESGKAQVGEDVVAWRYSDNVRPGLPWHLTNDPDVARSLIYLGGHDVEPLYTQPAQPAADPAVPYGWVLVPREPTAAMLLASYRPDVNSQKRAEMYAAMLAAAPKGVI